MVKKFLILFFLVASVIDVNSQVLTEGIKKYPSYKNVLKVFQNFYYPSDQNIAAHHYLKFARTPLGWDLILTPFEKEKSIKTLKFWRMEKGFLEVSHFTVLQEANPDSIKKARYNYYALNPESEHEKRMFRLHTYYNYTGWPDDIVEYLGPKKEQLNDADLYSLGRAYSAISMALCGSSNYSRLNSFDFNKNGNSLSKSQLDLFTKMNENSVKCFYDLYDRSPKFKTIVGDIQIKYANEVVQGYISMNLYQNEEVALKFLKKEIYPKRVLDRAKKYLDNCPKNAVLFTYGDNDSYPLIYLQAMENYRKDISVIITPILPLKNYSAKVRSWLDSLNFSLSDEFYNNYSYSLTGKEGIITVPGFFSAIQVESEYNRVEIGLVKGIRKVKKDDGLELSLDAKVSESYITALNVFQIDLIYKSDRPIVYTEKEASYGMFSDNLVSLGLVYWIDIEKDVKGGLKTALEFYNQFHSGSLRNEESFPLMEDSSDYVDAFSPRLYYNRILELVTTANNTEDWESKITLIEMWKQFEASWVVKPTDEQKMLFEQVSKD